MNIDPSLKSVGEHGGVDELDGGSLLSWAILQECSKDNPSETLQSLEACQSILNASRASTSLLTPYPYLSKFVCKGFQVRSKPSLFGKTQGATATILLVPITRCDIERGANRQPPGARQANVLKNVVFLARNFSIARRGPGYLSVTMPADSRCEKKIKLCLRLRLKLQVQNCEKVPVNNS